VLRKAFDVAVTRPQDRALLADYLPEAPPDPAPPSRPLKAPGEPPTGAAPA
jgi:hypothetical protein